MLKIVTEVAGPAGGANSTPPGLLRPTSQQRRGGDGREGYKGGRKKGTKGERRRREVMGKVAPLNTKITINNSTVSK